MDVSHRRRNVRALFERQTSGVSREAGRVWSSSSNIRSTRESNSSRLISVSVSGSEVPGFGEPDGWDAQSDFPMQRLKAESTYSPKRGISTKPARR